MVRNLVSSAIAIAVLTAVLGLAYPALMTGFAQVAFESQANGSLISVDGKVVGSTLAAQGFRGSRHLHPRPSAKRLPTTPARRRSRTSARPIRTWRRTSGRRRSRS